MEPHTKPSECQRSSSAGSEHARNARIPSGAGEAAQARRMHHNLSKFHCNPTLGVHSLSLERETSTGILANFSRELANFGLELANLKREFAEFKREFANFEPIIPGFDQLYPGNRRN